MRVLCYAQHLSGVGHFVRTHALACGLAQSHDVLLVDGGCPIPRLDSQPRLTLLSLPRLYRRAGRVVPLDDNRSLAQVREERIGRLVTAISEARPDVVTIEHYPFSKWELEDEILAAVRAARRVRPTVRVVCSLRDIAPQTSHETVGRREYERRVLDRLAAHFDALVVHTDPRFSRLEDYFAAAERLPIPSLYTGFVCTAGTGADTTRGSTVDPPFAVASAGGGSRALPFLRATIEAFERLSAKDELGPMRLVVFAGLFMEASDYDTLRAGTPGGLVTVLPYSPEFPTWLRRSEISISQAGYNTCVDLLSARVPAVLVPHAGMSDQAFRAQRMQTSGLATLAAGDPPPIDALMDAIRTARSRPRPHHDFCLRGVDETRAALEHLHGVGTERARDPIRAGGSNVS